jgi:hypothetical protein
MEAIDLQTDHLLVSIPSLKRRVTNPQRSPVASVPVLTTNIFIVSFSYNRLKQPVTVAVRSEAWFLAGWLLGSWVRIPLKAWMFFRVFLCCVVLCRYRPCDGLITRPSSPTICLNSSRNLLYVRRPRSFKDWRATGKIKKIG